MIEEKQYLSMEQKWNEKDRPLVPSPRSKSGTKRTVPSFQVTW